MEQTAPYGLGEDLRLHNLSSECLLACSRDEHASGLKPSLAGSDCNFLKIGGSGLDRNEHSFVILMCLF